jgi:3-hydroxyisobutyrate dehydrogenase-like beta-hydroxyacid dehydrogenase
VSGTPRDIAAGQLTVWAGGPAATLDSARAALGAYASPVLSVGPVGHGQRVKLVNNALFVAQVGLAVEAVRIAAGVGLGETDVLAALAHGSGASRALSAVAWIGAGNVGSRLSEFMIKDVDAVRVIAERAGRSRAAWRRARLGRRPGAGAQRRHRGGSRPRCAQPRRARRDQVRAVTARSALPV